MPQGIKETKEDRARDKERGRAADAYDDFDKRIEKHWTEKAVEEMTERDWRIFREDFSIAYKGNAGGTLPIRNWKEARLPEPLMKVRCSLFRRMRPACRRHSCTLRVPCVALASAR